VTPALTGIGTSATLCLAAATASTFFAAALVCVAGLDDEARATLRFGFAGLDSSVGETAGVAAHNGRIAGGTLVCAAIAPRLSPRVRRLVYCMLAAVLTCSACAVGVAIGAYGSRAIAAVVAHLPVEFGALSVAGGAYMQACKQALTTRELVAITSATALLIVLAAWLETHASLAGG